MFDTSVECLCCNVSLGNFSVKRQKLNWNSDLHSCHNEECYFWNVVPCSPVEIDRRFGGTYCLHLKDQRVSQTRSKHQVGRYSTLLYVILSACFFRGLLYSPEDGGSMFLQNVGELYRTTLRSIPEDSTLQQQLRQRFRNLSVHEWYMLKK
jgi:hypothetical protein